MRRNNNRRALSRLMRAADAALLPLRAHWAEGGEPAGGNATPHVDPKGEPNPKEPKPGDKPQPKYTDDDVSERVRLALEERDREAAGKAEREKKDREAEEARKRGEWEKVANDERAAREAAEKELADARMAARGGQVDLWLRDHLSEKHPDYAQVARYIRPLVTFEANTKDETIRQRIEEAAAQYVKDNPRQARGGAAPPLPFGNRLPAGSLSGTAADPEAQANGKPNRLSAMTRAF